MNSLFLKNASERRDGFIVLLSVIILSAVLLLLAATLSTSGYFQRRGVLDSQFRESSYFLALSCIDQAAFKLSGDLDYAGNETISMGQYQCSILPLVTEGTNTLIHSTATVDQNTSKLVATLNADLAIISIVEEN